MSQSASNESYGTVDGAYVPEILRLQNELEFFTERMEFKNSDLVSLEENIKQAQIELDEREQAVMRKKPNQLQELQTKIKIQSQNKNVKNERIRVNLTKTKNENLKREINVLRKELASSQNECKRFDKVVKANKKVIENQNKDVQAISKIAEETNNQIVALQAKHHEDKELFEANIQKLQLSLGNREEGDLIDYNAKEGEKTKKDAENQNAKGAEFSNPIVILKRRLNKITETNKEKRKLMEQYLRNVKVIEDAFDQIKQATGISNIDEIVTTFIKAEEQNYSLFNYVNMLNTEYDQLEESNQEIKDQISKIDERGQLNQQEKVNLEKSLADEVDMLNQQIREAQYEADNTKNMFKKIQTHVGIMVDMFKQSKFFLCVAQKQNYQNGIIFTENNIVSYLAELEEYMSSLITYTAFKKEDPNAPICSIPLEKLNNKNFQQAKINIDPPTDWEPKQEVDGTTADVDQGIISAKELYAKFMINIEQQNITIMTHGNKNQQQTFKNDEDELSQQ